jgi:hypothetical protein
MLLGGPLNSVASPAIVAGNFAAGAAAGGGTLVGFGAPPKPAAPAGANSVASFSMLACDGDAPGNGSSPVAIIVAANGWPFGAGGCATVAAIGSGAFGAAGAPAAGRGAGGAAGAAGAGGAAGAPGTGNCAMPPTMVRANALGFGALPA